MSIFPRHSVRILFAAFLMIFGLISPSLIAQNGGFAGASARMGYSARGMAMSNAMSAVTSEGAFSYYNPAQAALYLETRQTDLTVGALRFDRVFQSTGVQFQLPPTAGLSFSLLRTGVNDIDGRTQSGYPTELFDISEYQFASNFGIRFSDRMNGGIGLKFSLANYHQELPNATTVGIDLGLLYTGNFINIGFSVKDLFASYSWDSSDLYGLDQSRDNINNFPTRVIFGVAYQHEDFTISSDFEIQAYTSETPGSEEIFIDNGIPSVFRSAMEINTSSTQFRLGGSWKAHERVTLRGGWQLPEATNSASWGMSSGFSIHLPFDVFSPSVDYAFVVEPYRISNMHVFSLRLNL